jgi:hypothetical protein
MAGKDIIIGRVINLTGMIGVAAGIVLLAFGIVSLLFRRGLGLDIANPFTGFGSWRGGLLRALKSNEHKVSA